MAQQEWEKQGAGQAKEAGYGGKPHRKKKKQGVLYLLMLAAVAVLAFSLWQLSGIMARYEESDKVYDEILSHMGEEAVPVPLPAERPGQPEKPDEKGDGEEAQPAGAEGSQEVSETEGGGETEAHEQPYTLTVPDFSYLRSVNSDVVGWVQIPGTRINYPIVQGTDNEYYLNHTFSGEENTCGAIFMDAKIGDGFDDKNPIIHGHNLKSGAMFSRLNRYDRRSFWNTNRYVYITTPEGLRIYEVFSAYEMQPDTDIYYFGFSDNEEFQAYIDRVRSYSVFDAGIQVTSADDIVTLSTCANDTSRRFVVHAKRVQ